MFVLLVEFHVRAGRLAQFDRMTEELVRSLNENEPDTLVYISLADADAADSRVFVEVYRDEAAFDTHERSAHTVSFLSGRTELLAGPPVVRRLADLGFGQVLRAVA